MGVYVTNDNKNIISLAFDRTIQIHEMSTSKLLQQFETDTMKCSSLYNDEFLAIGTFSRTCMLFNIKTNSTPEIFTGHLNTVCVIDINSQYIVSASLDKYIFVWDWKLKKRVKVLLIPDEYYNRNIELNENTLYINFSLTELKIKNHFIIAIIHNYILIWDIEKDFELFRVITLPDIIKSFDTDGYIIYAAQIQSYCVISILEQEKDFIIFKNKNMNVIYKIIIDEKRIAFWYSTPSNNSPINSQNNLIEIINRKTHQKLFKCKAQGINSLNINKNTIIYGDYYGSTTLYDFS